MGSSARGLRILGLGVFLGIGLTGLAQGQEMTEFAAIGGRSGIARGPDGNVWYTTGTTIGRISTTGSDNIEFPVPSGATWDIVAGPDGNLWYTTGAKVGRITTTGVATEFSVPGGAANDLVVGPDGNLWFTEYYNDGYGRVTTHGVVTEFFDAAPSGLATGSDGNLWYVTGGSIGRLSPSEGPVADYFLPGGHSSAGITPGPDGSLWFVDGAANSIGRITMSGEISAFPIPTASSGPSGITAGRDGNLWFTETLAGKIGRISVNGEVTGEYPLAAGRHPLAIAAGPDGNVWFTEDAGFIGRITTGEPPMCAADSTTLCLHGGRYRVRAQWQLPVPGTDGPGRAIPMIGDTGAFWFFNPSSVELVVKIVDGCSLNGRAWVFAGGLTNVGVVVTVTDIVTGDIRTYVNPPGTPFQPIQDTAAFWSCP